MLIEQQAPWYLCRASTSLINITAQLRKENETLKRQLDEKIVSHDDLPKWVKLEIAKKHKKILSLRTENDLLKEELLKQELNSRPGDKPVLPSAGRDWLICSTEMTMMGVRALS